MENSSNLVEVFKDYYSKERLADILYENNAILSKSNIECFTEMLSKDDLKHFAKVLIQQPHCDAKDYEGYFEQ